MSLDVDPARSRAVLLGVSYFPRDPDRLPALPTVQNNLRDLGRALADPTILGIDPRHITVVDDRPSSEMLSRLVEAADEAEDTLIVYYAGHGVPGNASLFLTGTDSSEKTIEFDGIPFDRMRLAIQTSPARKKIVILDCCYSGRALDIMGTADAMLQAGIEELEGSYVLASSGATEASAAPPGERYTAFTGALLRVLYEGVADAPGSLKLREIFRALRLVLASNPALPKPRQAAKGSASDINFAHNRAWQPPMSDADAGPDAAMASEDTPPNDRHGAPASQLDRQSAKIELLQRQLAERGGAPAAELANSDAAEKLVRRQERPDRAQGGHSEDSSAIAEILASQSARIAELEAALKATPVLLRQSGNDRPPARGTNGSSTSSPAPPIALPSGGGPVDPSPVSLFGSLLVGTLFAFVVATGFLIFLESLIGPQDPSPTLLISVTASLGFVMGTISAWPMRKSGLKTVACVPGIVTVAALFMILTGAIILPINNEYIFLIVDVFKRELILILLGIMLSGSLFGNFIATRLWFRRRDDL